MSLEIEKKRALYYYENALKEFKQWEQLIEKYNNCIEISDKELQSNINKYVTYKLEEGRYEYILGGDGRSQPWSEYRNGLLCNVTINENIYLSDKQEEIIRRHFHNNLKFDKLNIIK